MASHFCRVSFHFRFTSSQFGAIFPISVPFGGGLGDGRDFGLFMGRVGFAARSDGRQIAWKDVTRHAVKDAEFVECQR